MSSKTNTKAIRWAYLLVTVIAPVVVLLYLQYESIVRQNRTIRQLTASNLTFAGQQIALLIEKDYYDMAQRVLANSGAAAEPKSMRRHGLSQGEALLDCSALDPSIDQILLIRPETGVLSSCGNGEWRDSYTALIEANEPGKILPLGTAAPAAQFFYVQKPSGLYVVASVNLRLGLGDIRSIAHVLGIPQRARVVRTGEPIHPGEVLVRFPTLFPFWRVALSPQTQDSPGRAVLIFAALTSVVLLLLIFALVLFTRASWRQWRLSQVRQEFVQEISHDLRTPVTSISMYSEMLTNGGLSSREVREIHEMVLRESHRLSSIVRRVLDTSKSKEVVKRVGLPGYDARSIVSDAVTSVEASAAKQGFRIGVSQPDAAPLLHCDREAIRRCVIDLLDNAIKYSGHSRRIQVETAVQGRELRITVRDYGIGIPAAEIPHICEQFYRAPNAREHQGYGLGLHLVKSVMDAHGGKLEISSILNKGSQFCLILPL